MIDDVEDQHVQQHDDDRHVVKWDDEQRQEGYSLKDQELDRVHGRDDEGRGRQELVMPTMDVTKHPLVMQRAVRVIGEAVHQDEQQDGGGDGVQPAALSDLVVDRGLPAARQKVDQRA